MSTETVSFIRDGDHFWGNFKRQLLKNRTRNRVNKIALSFCIWLCCCRPFRGGGGGRRRGLFCFGTFNYIYREREGGGGEGERERKRIPVDRARDTFTHRFPFNYPFRLHRLH